METVSEGGPKSLSQEKQLEVETKAAQSLDELRLDVMIVRRDVEKLCQSLPPDYSVTLGEIKKALGAVSQRLGKMEQHPALRIDPARQHELLVERAHLVMREPVLQFDRARRAAQQTERELTSLVRAVKTQAQQRKTFWVTAGAALAVGLIISPMASRLLPLRLNTRVAALVMATDRWRAGVALMEASNPDAWEAVQRASTVWQSNRNVIDACSNTAQKLRTQQRCLIWISP